MTGTISSYSRTAIFLHWLIAVLLVVNIAGGLTLESLFDSADPAKRDLASTIMVLHKSNGLMILVLSVVRLLLRLTAGAPPLPGHMTAVERSLAKITHWGFYLVLILLPLSGWVMSSANPRGKPINWFWLFDWPLLPIERSKELAEQASATHGTLAFVTIALIVLHVAAALKHQYFDRDDVLARMVPHLRKGNA